MPNYLDFFMSWYIHTAIKDISINCKGIKNTGTQIIISAIP